MTKTLVLGVTALLAVCAFAVSGAFYAPPDLLFAVLAVTLCTPVIFLPFARTPRSIFDTRRAGLA